ncbi:non-ribosomal peptide synthetase [Plantactinospora sp. BC1]|uniref:condensation domain-containing protein n=1 Tax=Plantactinospora sp. BC1 TaxID=2108470 RepID=UPI000D161D8C|nr:condensation domain-containing protein [Plantactinospora sp. BC1]AVT28234.1 non-ribosomal peptide synthetase [Plantactinospora sp. BC1]
MAEHDRAPLTPAQRRLWFLDRLDPGDPAYTVSTTVLLRGDLDVERLVGALDTVIARHESLRTRFVESGGVPVQEVLAARPTPVRLVEVSSEDEARRAVEELIGRPFDLAEGHLIRVGLLRLDARRHVLCTAVHHIVGDGWSMNLLYRQVAEAYRGVEPAAPGLRYLDHARSAQAVDEAALGYWRTALARPPVLELPLDRPRPAVRTSAGVAVVRGCGAELWTSVQQAARHLRCTPFMLLMTVYQLTLAQASGQHDICVGTPVAGRDDVAAESVFGYFTRMLVLRGDLSGDVTLRDLVLRTRATCLAAFAHQEIPFEQLVADLDLPRDPGRNPLFQAAFTLHSTMDVSATGFEGFQGLTVEAFGEGSRRTVTDVAMDVFVSSTAINSRSDDVRMDILLTCSADLFDPATADELADRFGAVLRAVLADPDTPVRALPLVDEAARAELTRIGTGPVLADGPPLLARIAGAVDTTPEAIALVSGADQVSYRELWARAGELADALRAAGVRPGQLVGVNLPRGPDLVVALLATWRVGAGYLPVDPGLPPRRRAALVEQAAVAAVLTVEGLRPGSTAPTRVPDPGYVLFTSGSTGTPKPVLVGRAALAARVGWMIDAYRLTGTDRVVQFAEPSFDTHAEEIWPTLATGGTLVLLPDGAQSLPELLAADPAITVLDLPTAYWQELLGLVPDWPAALRLVILGGEQVDATAVARWRDRHGDRIRLTNTYGPTEATIIATAIDLGAADTARRPPIGRPVGGARAYLLDEAGRLVPRGAVGELCLAGAGLADGYLGRPDLTAERFRPDPYGGGRLYRTGDRARWRRDEPVLEFLGRLDRQLKIRGVRVEPGEVEAVLTGHPEVGQAVVTALGETLVGYVTGTSAVAEVRAHAAERLPAPLVPSVLVPLAALPLTPHGKVDTAALPVPSIVDEARVAFEAPRTDAEELVAGIFAELLPVDRVGAADDFFALGGHSLLAVRVIARLRAAVSLDLPVRLLFQHPTVAGFARAVEAALVAEIDRLTEDEAAAELAAARTGAP